MQRTCSQHRCRCGNSRRPTQHGSLTATARTTDTHDRARQTNVTCKHQKQNGHTWGWRLAPGALATWMRSRASGARRGRGQPAWLQRAPPPSRARARTPVRQHPPPAPLSWALISPRPGYSIKGRLELVASPSQGGGAPRLRPVRRVVFIKSSV